MTMTEALAGWLQSCPALSGGRLNVNYLAPGADTSFAILETPGAPILAWQLDGTTTRQKTFALTSLQDYSPDLLQQLAASGVWEEISAWVEARDRAGDLPRLPAGLLAETIRLTSTQYLMQSTGQSARYQIQLALTYEQAPDTEQEQE